ncbi:hypothetical protein EV215_0907 [Hypnocyclicus thermotrophus]|uniref:Uncharacterized protein n=1 Tax=Hypnocyclicus thermotrophus TaxID=1627895 RepID=A0AA46DZC6_9FUSO|nr:hypothetical protein [Hypnocyclicus thermotrophus]TDT71530.1 hypothetical protein EV215_0907 [Hypnocyclicus thermotrophus]
MSVLSDLKKTLEPLLIPIETGVFSNNAPSSYIVVVPMYDTFELHADNEPSIDVQEARISLFSKGSYTTAKNAIVRALLSADFTITARGYVGYETETGYHHYNVDVAKFYEMEEN